MSWLSLGWGIIILYKSLRALVGVVLKLDIYLRGMNGGHATAVGRL
jgi:hypothetical protein